MRTCSYCHKTKRITAFHVLPVTRKRSKVCMVCAHRIVADWQARNEGLAGGNRGSDSGSINLGHQPTL